MLYAPVTTIDDIISRYRRSDRGNGAWREKESADFARGSQYDVLSRDCEIADGAPGISPRVPRQVHGTRCGPRMADPGLNHGERGIYKDSDVRPCMSVTPLDAPLRVASRCALYAAVLYEHGIPKIFTSSPDGRETNEKWPSIDVRARDTKKFIRVARKIYKRDPTGRKMRSGEIQFA